MGSEEGTDDLRREAVDVRPAAEVIEEIVEVIEMRRTELIGREGEYTYNHMPQFAYNASRSSTFHGISSRYQCDEQRGNR